MSTVLIRTRSILHLCKTAILGGPNSYTTGSISRAAFALSLPAMLELLIESLFVATDLAYMSQLGSNAITIAGITGSVILIIYSVPVGLNIAATALIARRTGEKNVQLTGITAVQVIYTGIAFSLLCSVPACLFSKEIIQAAGATEQLVQEGGLYATIRFGGILLLTLRVLMNGIFRGSGDAAMPMRTLLLAFATNAAAGGILIFGLGPLPAFGLTGAAIANVTANVLAISYQCWYMRKKSILPSRGSHLFKPVYAIIKKIITLAGAGTLQYLVPSSSWFLMIIIVSQLGTDTLTGYIIADRIIICTTLPAWGIANAAGVLTGQNLGAGQPERAERSVWRTGIFNMCFLGLLALVMIFFTGAIVRPFTNDPAVFNHAVLYCRCMAIAFFFFGYTMVISRSLNAAGYVKVVTWLYIFMFYVVQLPLAYVLGIGCKLGSAGIFSAILISEIVLAVACIVIFKKGRWKKVIL